MKKSEGKHFIAIILAISIATLLMSYVQAEAQWEAEWRKTLEAGKKEGMVSAYVGLLAPSVSKQAPMFKEKYGIQIEVTPGRGPDLLQKHRVEKAAGANLADVAINGSNTMLATKQLGVTVPLDNKLILPEVTNTKLWYTLDSLPWLDATKHLFSIYAYPNRDITINTDLVKPGEIQSWQDLLKPKYKGKIVWSDPTIYGSGFNGFCTNIISKVADENYYRQLVAKQDIVLSRDLRQMAEWLARGKYAIAVSVEGQAIASMLDVGAHIAYVSVKEGAYLSYAAGIVAIIANAPHPNAAKVFVNWLLSREGQGFAQRATRYQSARNDIPTEGIVNQQSMRVPGEKYFVAANTIEKWLMEDQEKYMERAKEIFGSLSGR